MLGSGLEDWMSGTDQAAQISEQSFEIGFDRLQQLGDGDHETPRRRDPSGDGLSSAADADEPQGGPQAREWRGWQNRQDPP